MDVPLAPSASSLVYEGAVEKAEEFLLGMSRLLLRSANTTRQREEMFIFQQEHNALQRLIASHKAQRSKKLSDDLVKVSRLCGGCMHSPTSYPPTPFPQALHRMQTAPLSLFLAGCAKDITKRKADSRVAAQYYAYKF